MKGITSAEGGSRYEQKEIAEKMALLRSHGVTRDENKMSVALVVHGFTNNLKQAPIIG